MKHYMSIDENQRFASASNKQAEEQTNLLLFAEPILCDIPPDSSTYTKQRIWFAFYAREYLRAINRSMITHYRASEPTKTSQTNDYH